MLRRSLFAVTLLLLAGCTRRDFDGMCKLATEILVEPRIARADRWQRFLDQVPNVVFGSAGRQAIEALPQVAPERRYEFLVEYAHEEGLKSWSCPALETVVSPPAETSN